MKKVLGVAFLISATLLTACSSESTSNEELEVLKIAASNVPHAEVLEKAEPILEEQGIDLEIEVFQDYILPNEALADGDVDANYFQHIPYFESIIEEKGYDFENAGGIHIEPIGVYSNRYKSLDKLPEGASIMLSSQVQDHGRILTLLQSEGLITLKNGIDTTKAELSDIVENPKNFEFTADIEPAMLVQAYENDEADAFLINSNYALDAGLVPTKDAIAIEDSTSPYVNIIAVRTGDKEKESIQKLIEVLHSEEIQNFILEEYEGSVVPVSE